MFVFVLLMILIGRIMNPFNWFYRPYYYRPYRPFFGFRPMFGPGMYHRPPMGGPRGPHHI